MFGATPERFANPCFTIQRERETAFSPVPSRCRGVIKSPQTYVGDVKGKSNENCGCASTSNNDDEDARVKFDSMRNRNSEICSYSNYYDRAFWGTFVTVELKKLLIKDTEYQMYVSYGHGTEQNDPTICSVITLELF